MGAALRDVGAVAIPYCRRQAKSTGGAGLKRVDAVIAVQAAKSRKGVTLRRGRGEKISRKDAKTLREEFDERSRRPERRVGTARSFRSALASWRLGVRICLFSLFPFAKHRTFA
jgi:hypothetical protein